MEKGSKLLTLLAIMGGIILGISVNSTQPACAKSPIKITKMSYNLKQSGNYVSFTGNNALYTKAAPLKGAKVVKTKQQLLELNQSKAGQDTFMYLRSAYTNHHTVYYKVMSFDRKIKGWIYAGKTSDIQSGLVHYAKDKKTVVGGINSFETLQNSPLNDLEKNEFYHLKYPGSKNNGSELLYQLPFWCGPDGKTKPNMKSTIKYRHDVFIIENAMTRTREGDRWLVIHDLSNTNIVGYIKDGSLIPMHSVPATEGITVNYVDKATNRPVKSVIVPFAKSPKQAGMNLKTSFFDYNGLPDGYTADDDSLGFKGNSATNAIKGATLNYFIVKQVK